MVSLSGFQVDVQIDALVLKKTGIDMIIILFFYNLMPLFSKGVLN